MKAMNEQAIAVLRAILAEVAGHEAPFSADSYLPSHLVHDMRQVIEQHERFHEQAIARRQQEASAAIPVEVMVDAQQCVVHIDTGESRPAKAYRLENGIRTAVDLGGR